MKRFAIPFLVLISLAGLGIWAAMQKTRPHQVAPINCVDPVAGCPFVHGNLPGRVRFSVAPESLKPFVIILSHPRLKKVSLSFQMMGMDMGYNRYELARASDGAWTARIILPVCTASRADWIAEIQLDDQFYSLPFTAR